MNNIDIVMEILRQLPKLTQYRYRSVSKSWNLAYLQYLVLDRFELTYTQQQVVDDMLASNKILKIIKYPVGWGKTYTVLGYLLRLLQTVDRSKIFPAVWISGSGALATQSKDSIDRFLRQNQIRITTSMNYEDLNKVDIVFLNSHHRRYQNATVPTVIFDENSKTPLEYYYSRVVLGGKLKNHRIIVTDAEYNPDSPARKNIPSHHVQELIYQDDDTTDYKITDIRLEYHHFLASDHAYMMRFLRDKCYIDYVSDFVSKRPRPQPWEMVVERKKEIEDIQRFLQDDSKRGLILSIRQNKGLNIPKINAIITTRDANHLQQIGRGIRRGALKQTMYIVVVNLDLPDDLPLILSREKERFSRSNAKIKRLRESFSSITIDMHYRDEIILSDVLHPEIE